MPWRSAGDSRAIEALPWVEALPGCVPLCKEECAQPLCLLKIGRAACSRR